MAKRPEHEMELALEQWRKRMYHEDFSEMTDAEQAKEIGVAVGTIGKWHKTQTKAFWENRESTMRGMYAKHMPQIDLAVIKKAKLGDTNAAELSYKRFEGWSPKQTNENINRNAEFEGKSDEEIQLETLRKADPGLLKRVLGEKGALGEVVEPTKVENG